MTSNTPDLLEKIRAKCAIANPEIVELVPGVRIYVPNHTTDKKQGGSYATYLGKQGCGIKVLWEDGKEGLFHESTIINIISRPIRLADVLLAIANENPYSTYFITDAQDFGRATDGRYELGLATWDCMNDSLEDQSPECITFISSILGVV